MKNLLTLESFADWCEKQPAEKRYWWCLPDECACGQYARHLGVEKWDVGVTAGSFWDQANEIAFEVPSPKTFGALASRLRAAIAKEPRDV